MRKHTTTYSRNHTTTTLVVLALAAAAATAAAEPPDAEFCPPSFECSPRMKVLLAQGMEQSESFRAIVQNLGFDQGISLDLMFRRPQAGKRAQSDLKVAGYYDVENGERFRRVTGVSGEVTVPYASYGHKQIGLIAHELGHVLIRLRGGAPIDRQVEEREANQIEDMVSAELELARAIEKTGG
jgi:hypothetical protein